MPKILIIRFSSIGDIVLTTPVIRCIKKQVPGCELHYLTKQQYAPLIKANPYLDKVHYLNENLFSLIKRLRQEKFDFIVDLHHNLRTFFVKYSLWVKSKAVNKLNFQKWLLVNLRINLLPDKHIVDRYIAAASPLNIWPDGQGLDYFIPKEDQVPVSQLPKRHQNKGFIAFMVGAKFTTKQLPVEKIIHICRESDYPIVLLGGEMDFHLGSQIASEVGNKVYNACGLYNINQSASLVEQAHKVVTHDTGIMHIAAAFQKEIISIWGNTVPEFGMSPYFGSKNQGISHIMEIKDLPCRPCTKLGYTKCPKGHFYCMRMQDEEEIIQLINQSKAP